MVENYKRPAWTYNKVCYIEKEGFVGALKANSWPERYDCTPMSSKGFTTRAARDLIDKLAEHDEPVTIFCVHDADGYGTMIYQTFQEAPGRVVPAKFESSISDSNLGKHSTLGLQSRRWKLMRSGASRLPITSVIARTVPIGRNGFKPTASN
jgi:hypothetical protein